MNIQSGDFSGNMKAGTGMDYNYLGDFLTNELVFGPPQRGSRFWPVYHISGKLVAGFNFDGPDYYIRTIFFANDLKKAFAETNKGNYLIDIKDFHDKLDSLGFIFHPTTGTLNDSRVRIRENPNLDAGNLGYMNEGDKVDILERSGIKVQIGEMNDWWYKVKTKDGIVGWAYGTFIDLDE